MCLATYPRGDAPEPALMILGVAGSPTSPTAPATEARCSAV
jgi:hypothetical protein